jgi:hypothetical protein
MHTQMRGIINQNVHTPFALRMGKQAKDPAKPGIRQHDIIFQYKKQQIWAESCLLNDAWFASAGITTARACVISTHAFVCRQSTAL